MKAMHLAALLAALPACSYAAQARGGATPIGKVLELLTGLEAKIRRDAEAELKAHNEYMAWCKDGKKDLEFEVQTTEGDIEDLGARIKKAESTITAETSRIDGLANTISQNDADMTAAEGIREKESTDFRTAEAELVETLGMLDRAITILQRKMRKGSALVQASFNTKNTDKLVAAMRTLLDAASFSAQDGRRLAALAQSSTDDEDSSDDLGAPAPEAYASHSEGIIEVLEDLRMKGESQLKDLRRQETNARHSYEMVKQSLTDQIAADTKEMGAAKKSLAAAGETKSTASGDLEEARKSLAEDQKTLATMDTSCAAALEDHEATVKSREEELQALAEAKKVLKDSTSGADATVYSGASFLQLASSDGSSSGLATRFDLANFEVVNLLRRLAKKENSPALAQLASRVASVVHFGAHAGQDPFAKVKELIREMLARLEKEAGEEAKHKAWCDEQMGDTQAKLDDLKAGISSLTAKIDKARSQSVRLKAEVQERQAALAELAKTQAELDSVRKEENSMFVATKADLEQGIKGVRTAIQVLRDYYEQNDASHAKAEGAGSSIVGLLEVVESDITKSLAEANIAEDTAAAQYEKVSMQNRLNKASYEQDVKYKTKEAAGLDKRSSEDSADRESQQTELDSVLEYSATIRGACEVKPENYEERKGRRDAELAGLKEALQILQNESFLQRSNALRGGRARRQ